VGQQLLAKRFDQEGNLSNDDSRNFLKTFIDAFVKWTATWLAS
jgi:hypothetical protein